MLAVPPLTVTQILELVAIGGVAGLLGGLLGIGGGVVMIPAMALVLGQRYGPESFHLYKLAAISTTVLLSIPAVMRHVRAKAIVGRLVRAMIPYAAIGVVVGVWLSSRFVDEDTRTLRRVFGVFLELTVVISVYQDWYLRNRVQTPATTPGPRRHAVYGMLTGWPTGFLAGFLGVGGGVWAVPSQRILLGVEMRNAIANSSATILPVAVITVATQSLFVVQRTELPVERGFLLALCLAPAALLGAWLGAGLTHRLPVSRLRLAFQVLLVIAGLRLMLA